MTDARSPAPKRFTASVNDVKALFGPVSLAFTRAKVVRRTTQTRASLACGFVSKVTRCANIESAIMTRGFVRVISLSVGQYSDFLLAYICWIGWITIET